MASPYSIACGVVAPAQLVPFMRTLQAEARCPFVSVYRGQDAAGLLNSIGLHTQAQIYQEWIDGQEPNPANPPGRSTHECRSDGVAYPGPIGRVLEWWQCGMDVDDAYIEATIAAGAKYGWELFRPYPSGSEYHHLNFRVQPKSPVIDLRVGDTGNLVGILSARLRIISYVQKKTTIFGPHVHAGVVRFQRNHHLKPDGIVGPKTWSMLKRAAEYQLGHNRNRRKK